MSKSSQMRKRIKSNNMNVNDVNISPKIENKGLLNLEKILQYQKKL